MRTSFWIWKAIMIGSLAGTLACGDDDGGDDDAPAETATATISGLGTNTGISGTLTFTATNGVAVSGTVSGLAPDSVHGFHLHQTGDCSDPTGMSAGAHWNPTMQEHGAPTSATSHFGDLGNITADASGVATVSVTKMGPTVGDGAATDLVGRAVIVHAMADDFTTPMTGNAGARIACGVVQ